MASVEKLAGLDFDVICFSHFAPLRENASGRLRAFARHETR